MASIIAPLDVLSKPIPILTHTENVEEHDEWHMPTFAFHDLDYVPSGYGGILAPYIETGPGTMRAAVTLMRLDVVPEGNKTQKQNVICDLGCGDGEFLLGLLTYLNRPPPLPLPPSNTLLSPTLSIPPPHLPLSAGFGIDYNAHLISTATSNASIHPSLTPSTFLIYDFNLDIDDLYSKITSKGVTHIFVYLVPKQLELKTVRGLLERLVRNGVCVCCHKFLPGYLDGKEGVRRRSDDVMSLCVYEWVGEGEGEGRGV